VYERGIVWLYVDGTIQLKGAYIAKGIWSLEDADEPLAPLRLYLGSDRHDAYWSNCSVANVLLWTRALPKESLDFLRKL
jgi:hypothetical protein